MIHSQRGCINHHAGITPSSQLFSFLSAPPAELWDQITLRPGRETQGSFIEPVTLCMLWNQNLLAAVLVQIEDNFNRRVLKTHFLVTITR